MGLTRIVVATLALSVATSAAQQSDIFTSLGTTRELGQNSLVASLTSGAVTLIGTRSVFTSASPEVRATLVRDVVAAARAFTGTADFTSRYARFREAQRPQREALPQTGDEALAAQQKQLEEVIRQAEKTAESLPPDAREKLAHNIAYTKQQLADLNADPEHRASVDAAVKENARQADAEFARKDAEFEVEYPADPKRLIARRLRAFLEMSATVDFSAQLVEKEKRMRFVDPELEAKPREWKMLYRAGKPAVDTARAAAEEWLKALGV
jgi:hypothetical protein